MSQVIKSWPASRSQRNHAWGEIENTEVISQVSEFILEFVFLAVGKKQKHLWSSPFKGSALTVKKPIHKTVKLSPTLVRVLY